ncbi:MAG: polyribonucleotide nucleotidyltransferase [Firmicutes bacterium]|nr:polyribonucleotide nucleotidyltransferase [Ezakiella sp.]MDD7761849.1 polyribonucleotide nucleotidyltransferase [Bacillota bacterium]
MEKIFKTDLAGRELSVSIGKYAEQAAGACFIRYGDTVLLVTATSSKKPREGVDFFPLSVDYEEKYYAAGKIPGGFIKREGRPSEHAILTSRLIDRPIRPLFPEGYRNDVQVIAELMSYDPDCSSQVAAMIGASIALSISDIPFNGPIGAVQIGFIDKKYIVNPTVEESDKSDINLTVAGTHDAIMMVEAGANEVSESEMLEAIMIAHEEIKKITEFINEIVKEVGKEKQAYTPFEIDPEVKEKINAEYKDAVVKAMNHADKMARVKETDELVDKIKTEMIELFPEKMNSIAAAIDEMEYNEVRRQILVDGVRPDMRDFDEIRPLSAEVALLPRTHGSGLFKRGQTQVLSIATLGVGDDAQVIDGMLDEYEKKYIHHYNFPPFSVGDTKPLRSPGRREIGHGALAERALVPVIPSQEDFPYTIRVVSEVLSSNGSSSQASICGSTLALMDAGVPIKRPVAGIAMGLVSGDNGEKVILTDIQGLEDHLGDMDFKVAGTTEGITALQMDIKISGIDRNILEEALQKAKKARFTILDVINSAIDKPREDISPYAPRLIQMQIDPEKIREVIGTGGKVINAIIAETGVKIDIEDDGSVVIASVDSAQGLRAKEIIENIVKDPEIGEVYEGKVTKIMNFGAFVSILNGKEGLLHISQIDHNRVEKVEDVLKTGDDVTVKVIGIDKDGKIDLSRKALLPVPEGFVEERPRDRGGRRERSDRPDKPRHRRPGRDNDGDN